MHPPPRQAAPGYHVLKTITLGGDGGLDYLNLDPATGNLYITRGNHVMVVDPGKGRLLADIADLPGIHGTAFVGGKAYVSEGGANRVAVIDGKSFKKIGEIAVGTRPDGILYDAASKPHLHLQRRQQRRHRGRPRHRQEWWARWRWAASRKRPLPTARDDFRQYRKQERTGRFRRQDPGGEIALSADRL